jgi:hypothetical protein
MRLRVGRCICAIRLHILILVTTAIETTITGGRHVLARESARERDPTLQALLRSLHRMEEEVRPFLTPEEMLFVFADVPRASFRIVMWSVPKVASINALGVERLLQCAPHPPPPLFRAPVNILRLDKFRLLHMLLLGDLRACWCVRWGLPRMT